MQIVNVIGAGLAGSEAAYQLLKMGYEVHLYEMKPKKYSPVHKNANFAELVCSNSLKSNDVSTAGGLLKEELRTLGSMVISVADQTRVPAGGALAVNREEFSATITKNLKSNANLKIFYGEVKNVDLQKPTIIATGPLTSNALSESLKQVFGQEYLYFFDAIAPIVSHDSINFEHAYVSDRYDKGTGDYVNCPMSKEEYLTFYNELIHAEIVKLKDFENKFVYEGCMPVEVLAKRGEDALRFGPLKPVGLINPKTGKTPYAVVQLRKETKENVMYNMVGFQTNLTYGEQKRVFSLVPALHDAEFLRFGVMHKNTYINAPSVLNKYYQVKTQPNIFIAGQLSGVEGYIESISSGLVSAINMDRYLKNLPLVNFGTETMIGGLMNYLETASPINFQPMGCNMGLVSNNLKIKDKKEKYRIMAENSLKTIKEIAHEFELMI